MWVFHKIFKREKYDCIQITSAHPICLAAALVAKRLNIPIVGFYHTLLPEYVPSWSHNKFNHFPFHNFITKFFCSFVSIWTWLVYNTSDIILAPTNKVKTSLEQKFVHKKIGVVGRGVDTKFFQPLKKSNSKLRLIYVGRISPEKTLEKLSFLGKYNDLSLTIVGDGSDLIRIKELLPFAQFKGNLQSEKLSGEYGASDIFIFPSITDAYANVVSEALSCGLPVVAYKDAGVEDRVDNGINGFLVSTIQDFELAVNKLKDPELRKKMSHQARLTALKLKWDTAFDQQLNAFPLAIKEYHNRLKRFFPILRKVLYSFNFSHAILGAVKMAFYVFLANVSAGLIEGIFAGMRQSLISFMMVGINTSFFEFLYFRSRRLSIILPSLLTTTVGTSIHTLTGTPNIILTASTIFSLALFNFVMLSEIYKRHETISPWKLMHIFLNFLINSIKQIKLKGPSNV
jgi:glycosyltransferase involved in cell wall biosynthesis